MILDVRETKPNASLKELIEDYKSFKGEEILAHQEIFQKEYIVINNEKHQRSCHNNDPRIVNIL